MIWDSSSLEKALQVSVPSGIVATAVQFNSRDIKSREVFIALAGEAGDGHNYVADALNNGAAVAIVSKPVHGVDESKIIQVADTYKALLNMAEYKRSRSTANVIGITGSAGKTSTKEAMTTLLTAFGKTFASRGTFNNHIGVPLDLASLPDDAEYVVIEMGMNHPGEIRTLTKLVKPHIAIITNVVSAHLEFFASEADIADAKSEIFEGMDSNGVAILNYDNPHYELLKANALARKVSNILKFGSKVGSDSGLESYHMLGATEVELRYNVAEQALEITRSLLPKHIAQNIAACLLALHSLNLDLTTACKQIAKIEMLDGRGKIIESVRHGVHNTILLDYYNSNPASLKASLEYLASIPHYHKVAIIADMLELGNTSIELHKSIAPFIVAAGVKKLLLIGPHSSYIAEELPASIKVQCFDHVDKVISNLDALIQDGDFVLLKGSKGMQLRKLAEIFKGREYVVQSA